MCSRNGGIHVKQCNTLKIAMRTLSLGELSIERLQ